MQGERKKNHIFNPFCYSEIAGSSAMDAPKLHWLLMKVHSPAVGKEASDSKYGYERLLRKGKHSVVNSEL